MAIKRVMQTGAVGKAWQILAKTCHERKMPDYAGLVARIIKKLGTGKYFTKLAKFDSYIYKDLKSSIRHYFLDKPDMSAYPPLRYIDARFECRFLSSALLPAYPGSMLRGVLGRQLRNGLCMTRNRDCAACLLGQNCIFPRIFNPASVRGLPVPAPFCIEPPLSEKRAYEPFEIFAFNLKLFSYGVEYLPFFVQAFRMAGEGGLGSKAARFTLEKVICAGKNIYNSGADSLAVPEPEYLPEPVLSPGGSEISGIALTLLTPLRFKDENHFSAELDFFSLLRLILRRIRNLYLCEGIAWQADQYDKMVKAATSASVTCNNFYWHNWTRYSSRQDAYMKLGGLMGKICYAGELSAFHSLLEIARIAHIGKQTSFGLGRLRVETWR